MNKLKFLPDLYPRLPIIEVYGDGYMLIEGCQGILIYDPCYIKLALQKTVFSISGTNLTLQHLTPTCAGISGNIASMAFGE